MAQVVTVESVRKYIYLSGQVSRDAQGNIDGAGALWAQVIQVGECVIAGLKAAGATLENVVKTQTFVTDMAEYQRHPDLRVRYFTKPMPPAPQSRLKVWCIELMIEVDVIAMVWRLFRHFLEAVRLVHNQRSTSVRQRNENRVGSPDQDG